MDASAQHTQSIIEQFSKQAAYFGKLPGHAEATQLLLDVAGVTASADVLDIACGAGAVARTAASNGMQAQFNTRKGLGTIYTQDDFNTWRANFGNTIGSGANQFAPSDIAVPEPATVMSAILSILLSSFVRRRR